MQSSDSLNFGLVTERKIDRWKTMHRSPLVDLHKWAQYVHYSPTKDKLHWRGSGGAHNRQEIGNIIGTL